MYLLETKFQSNSFFKTVCTLSLVRLPGNPQIKEVKRNTGTLGILENVDRIIQAFYRLLFFIVGKYFGQEN
jgi:hypothetical protein